jgi:hypothetical protein
MKHLARLIPMLALVAGLSACGEKPQNQSGVKSDVPAYMGADNKYPAPDWKRGDKSSWEQELKARAQNTQNEYTRIQ